MEKKILYLACLSVFIMMSASLFGQIASLEGKPLDFFDVLIYGPQQKSDALAIMLDNEYEKNDLSNTGSFYCNPLVLNQKTLDYSNFSIASKGVLKIATGNPNSMESESIPFSVCLRRDGKIINNGWSNASKEVLSVEIEKVLKMAKPMDHLIINPTRKKDWKAKRILLVLEKGGC